MERMCSTRFLPTDALAVHHASFIYNRSGKHVAGHTTFQTAHGQSAWWCPGVNASWSRSLIVIFEFFEEDGYHTKVMHSRVVPCGRAVRRLKPDRKAQHDILRKPWNDEPVLKFSF